MPLKVKSFKDFSSLIAGKFTKEVKGIDPTIKASLSRSSTVSTAAGAVSLQEGAVDVVKQSFYQTADDDFLELIGEYDNTVRFDPQVANGQAAVGGVLGTSVPSSTPSTYAGNTYFPISDSSVLEYSGDMSLSFSAGLVTATTSLVHTLSTGLLVTVTGAVQTEYNGAFEIIALDEETFTYELTAGALGADTAIYSSEYALLNIESSGTGDIQNIGSGGVMAIDLTNIDPTPFVGVGGVIGGSDEETVEDYRERTGEAHNLTPGISTPPSIKFSAKSIQGNTRVFIIRPVKDVTGGTPGEAGYKPQPGETVVYLLRDKDPSIIPNSAKLTETKNKIISDGNWPNFIDEEFLYVLAPILAPASFVFTTIEPNSITMQNAIRDQLVSFFEDNSEIEGTISLLDTLNPFLRSVQDPTTGEFLRSFTYTSPATDIIAGPGEISTRGDVTFA